MKLINLIVKNLKEGIDPHSFNIFMFAKIDQWKDFQLNDWQDILAKIKNNKLGLYAYIPFMYKFIGIDFYTYFDTLTDVNQSVKEYILDAKENNSFLSLYKGELKGDLPQYGIDFQDFKEVRDKLITQGGVKVEKIKYMGTDPPSWIELS